MNRSIFGRVIMPQRPSDLVSRYDSWLQMSTAIAEKPLFTGTNDVSNPLFSATLVNR
jgi:hypothetical protein